MKTNFEIEENYAVRFNGIHIDLHNNFEFEEIIENDNDVLINFIKSSGNWVHNDEFEKLTFLHKNVSYQNSEKGDNFEFPEDENTLSTITFFPKTIRDNNECQMEHHQPNENDDIIYLFQNGKMFRINCTQIDLIVQ